MIRIFAKPTIMALCLVLIFSMLGGCRGPVSDAGMITREASGTTLAPTSEASFSAIPVPGTTASDTLASSTETTAASFEYSWDPHVFSQIDRDAIGAEAEQFFYDLIDAVIAGKESVPCADQDLLWGLDLAMNTFFPPYDFIVSDSTYADGEVRLQYRLDSEQREVLLRDFAEQIETLVEYAELLEEDSPTVRAIKLYRMYSVLIRYDYGAEDNDVVTDVSCYRGLMELEGICQSFASAYAYLCLQSGVEATTVTGMNSEYAHEWTILTLDDNYYYADPTFESGDGGYGLKYFGMTAAQRELAGEFIADEYNIGHSNHLWGKDIDVTDEAFAPLWEAVYVFPSENEDGEWILMCEKADGSVFEYEIR
ncbi:MAG: hypothetical protein PHP22_11935 [Oscillospiraceae bacterium]|nr:hypothetical protein [Oscillospiraceae bacterium]